MAGARVTHTTQSRPFHPKCRPYSLLRSQVNRCGTLGLQVRIARREVRSNVCQKPPATFWGHLALSRTKLCGLIYRSRMNFFRVLLRGIAPPGVSSWTLFLFKRGGCSLPTTSLCLGFPLLQPSLLPLVGPCESFRLLTHWHTRSSTACDHVHPSVWWIPASV